MENITMTNTTQITRVRFACPQIADRSRTVAVDWVAQGTALSSLGFRAPAGFGADLRISATTPVPTFYAPAHKALAVKDVVYLRPWRPPV